MRSIRPILFSAVLAILPLTAQADMDMWKAGDIEVHKPWARASATSVAKSGAAYVMLKNTGGAGDTLVSVASDVARKTEIHLSSMQDGKMVMRPVEGIDVPAGGMAELKPGSFHVMFMGLKAPFKQGDSFPLTLNFAKSGSVTVTVQIMEAGAMGDMKGHSHSTN